MAVSLQKQPEKQSESLENQVKEWWKCKKSFLHFLQNFVYIQDRNKQQTLKWESWPYLVWLAEWLESGQNIFIGKARQLGVSWLVCIYNYWKVIFSENVKVLMLSQKEDPEAFDLIDKCRFVDDHVPPWMRSKREPDQRGALGFPDIGGILRALASTETAGRSTDATVIFSDEMEYHPFAERNFGALRPTLSGGGQHIIATTFDPLTAEDKSFAKQLYIRARSGASGYKALFLPWHIRPGRDEGWWERETKDMPSWQKQGEYPATEAEMLATLRSRPFFLLESIKNMRSGVREPIKHELSARFPTVRIYKPCVVGEKYLLANDPSEGKEDPHAIIVTDKTGEEVAQSRGKTTADQCALIHDALVREYNNALNVWETGPGGAGGIVSNKLEELKTPNRCPSINVSKRPFTLDWLSEKKGWWTSKSLWDVLVWELEEAVRLYQITPRSDECLNEFESFIVPEGQEPHKPRGGHDDYIDAWARVWCLRKFLQVGNMKITSFKYKE